MGREYALLLVATAIALVAAYLLLQQPAGPGTTTAAPPPTPAQPTAPTPSQTPTPTATPTTAAPPPTTPAQTPKPTQTATPTAPQTPTATPTPATAAAPRFEVSIKAEDVETRRLPVNVTYWVFVKNVGNATGRVVLAGRVYELRPGETVNATRTLTVESAGTYNIAEVVETEAGNITARGAVSVRYYAPILVAEPVEINVTKIPATVEVEVAVRNVGNDTAVVSGIEIKPGDSRALLARLNITAAGAYRLRLDGVEVPVVVRYLLARVEVRPLVEEVEALPGEVVEVPLEVKNTGNATAIVQVAGEELMLRPGKGRTARYPLKAEKAGFYKLEVKAGDVPFVAEVKVSIIKYSVQISLIAPVSKAGLMERIQMEDTIEVKGSEVEIIWQPIINTNATRRALTFNVDGVLVVAEPGKPTYLPERRVKASVPGDVELSVAVNGTVYTLRLHVRLLPPTLVGEITEVRYTDRQTRRASLKCGPNSFTVEVYEVEASVNYREGKFSGRTYADLPYFGKRNVYFSGEFNSAGGKAELTIEGVGEVLVEFALNPLRVTKAALKDGRAVPCELPAELLPRILEQPTRISARLDDAARALIGMFRGFGDWAEVREVRQGGVVILATSWGDAEMRVGDNTITIRAEKLIADIYGSFRLQ